MLLKEIKHPLAHYDDPNDCNLKVLVKDMVLELMSEGATNRDIVTRVNEHFKYNATAISNVAWYRSRYTFTD